MRILVMTAAVVAALAGVITQWKSGGADSAAPTPAIAAVQPATPREPSEHNWPKRALNRAGDVKRQVAEQRSQDGTR